MPALLVALVCAGALAALGDLRAATWQAMALLLAWGLLAVAMHALDLRRLAVGPAVWRRLDPDPRSPPPRAPWRLDVRRLSPWAVLAGALLVRAVLLASPATLSDDVYRYIWEGWLTLHGGNPYLSPPAGDFGALDHPVRALVNHPEVSTIYPPVVMWLFAGLAAVSPQPMLFKAVMGLADAGTAAILAATLRARGHSTAPAWLYAVLPLGAVESAGSGHMEPLGVLCLVLALWAWSAGRGGLRWAALGALVKLLPGALLPVLWRGPRGWRARPWLLLAVLALGLVTALPFAQAGPSLVTGFSAYAQRWSFNASGFALLSWLLPIEPGGVRLFAVGCGALVSLLAWWHLRDPARVALWIGGAFVLLSPTVHPWYLLWVWVPALVCGVRSWTVLALLAPLSYAALASYDPNTSTWEEPAWPVWAQYLPLAAALTAESLWHLIRPGPWQAQLLPASLERFPPTPRSPSASPT